MALNNFENELIINFFSFLNELIVQHFNLVLEVFEIE